MRRYMYEYNEDTGDRSKPTHDHDIQRTASNLTKFIQLLNTDEIDETVMIKLGLLAK